jgi:NAD-dependent dihydropyrimidine dehydrogenase PreA subunit/flavodoxin
MIFWFSATGNSRYAAERIAAATGEPSASIGAALKSGRYDWDISGDGLLGFVLPTFAWTLPAPVYLFIERLRLTGLGEQPVFGLFTCGENSGQAGQALRLALKARGLPFDGGFELVMPDNFILWSELPGEAELKRLLAASESELELIIKRIKARKFGNMDGPAPQSPFMPLREAGASREGGGFWATEACTGCGLCERLCPLSCIKIKDGRPSWEGECCLCLACLHRCPAAAIEHGEETRGRKRYRHPCLTPEPEG